jgi:hypothetical protein
MQDIKAIIHAIRSATNKDSNAYKITEYYECLIGNSLDEGGIVFVRSKILNIEKYLTDWVKTHPKNESTIMQPEEQAFILIDDLKAKGFLD